MTLRAKIPSVLCPTDLTWEEENPSHYLFNKDSLVKLKKTIKEIRKGKVKIISMRV